MWALGKLREDLHMAVSVNLAKALDKDFEDKSLKEILDASPAALAGITDAKAAALKELLGVKTIRELGSNKYFAIAGVLVALEGKAG
jgi:hypothetical protein